METDRVLRLVIEPSWGDEGEPVTAGEWTINSSLFAKKSLFFDKLFSNGFRETEDELVTIRIEPCEEYSVTELITFIKTNELVEATEIADFLDILVTADKFFVPSCVKHCGERLMSFPMTVENALTYLRLPWHVLMGEAVQPLVESAKDAIANHYKHLTNHPEEEVMALPLLAIQGLFSNDDLIVINENFVYDALETWAEENYSSLQERQEIFSTHLAPCIRFTWMNPHKLEEVLVSGYLKAEVATKLVLEALIFKTASRLRQNHLAANQTDRRFVERTSYQYKPVKIVEFHEPHYQRIIYMDLKRTECEKLFPSHIRYSQGFRVGWIQLHISARCNMDKERLCLGLFIEQTDVKYSDRMDYEFSVRAKPTGDFLLKHRGTTMTKKGAVGCEDLLEMAWTDLMAEDSMYFFEDVLHIRVDLSIHIDD